MDRAPLALPTRLRVRLEPEPREVGAERGFESPPRALTVVILDAEEDPATQRSRQPPDVQGIEDMAEMEGSGRRRSEAGGEGAAGQGVQPPPGICGDTGGGGW
jgi:hypothetical protein